MIAKILYFEENNDILSFISSLSISFIIEICIDKEFTSSHKVVTKTTLGRPISNEGQFHVTLVVQRIPLLYRFVPNRQLSDQRTLAILH